MRVPRLTDLACSTVTDQAGLPALVILGVDAHGDHLGQAGRRALAKISRDSDESDLVASTARDLAQPSRKETP